MALPTPRHLWRAGSVTGLASGAEVTVVADEGSSPTNMNGSTAGARPIWVSNVLKDQPVFQFDGSNDILTAARVAGLALPFMFIYVARASVVPAASNVILDLQPDVMPFTGAVAKPAGWIAYNGGPGDAVDGAVVANQWQVHSWYFQDPMSLYSAGTLTTITNAAGHTGVPTFNTWFIGGHGTAAQLNGQIAEVAIFQGALSSVDRADWHTRIQDLYGITVSDYVSPLTGVFDPMIFDPRIFDSDKKYPWMGSGTARPWSGEGANVSYG